MNAAACLGSGTSENSCSVQEKWRFNQLVTNTVRRWCLCVCKRAFAGVCQPTTCMVPSPWADVEFISMPYVPYIKLTMFLQVYFVFYTKLFSMECPLCFVYRNSLKSLLVFPWPEIVCAAVIRASLRPKVFPRRLSRENITD